MQLVVSTMSSWSKADLARVIECGVGVHAAWKRQLSAAPPSHQLESVMQCVHVIHEQVTSTTDLE